MLFSSSEHCSLSHSFRVSWFSPELRLQSEVSHFPHGKVGFLSHYANILLGVNMCECCAVLYIQKYHPGCVQCNARHLLSHAIIKSAKHYTNFWTMQNSMHGDDLQAFYSWDASEGTAPVVPDSDLAVNQNPTSCFLLLLGPQRRLISNNSSSHYNGWLLACISGAETFCCKARI